MDAAEELEQKVLELTVTQRAWLAEKLLRSLGEYPDDQQDPWQKVAQSRFQELVSGEVAGKAAEDVFRDAFGRLARRD